MTTLGLVTEIVVCKFLRGWQSYGLKPFLSTVCVYKHIFLPFFVQCIVGIMRNGNAHYYYYYRRYYICMYTCVCVCVCVIIYQL